MTAVMGCFDLQRLANMILAKCHRLVEKFGLKSPRCYVPTNITRRLQLTRVSRMKHVNVILAGLESTVGSKKRYVTKLSFTLTTLPYKTLWF
jgi:hypothetical protein